MRTWLLAGLCCFILAASAFADIYVYDAGGQCLGVLESQASEACTVYSPSMGVFFRIDNGGALSRTCTLHWGMVYYESSDCTGDPFLALPVHNDFMFEHFGVVYKPGGEAGLLHARSVKQGEDDECLQTDLPGLPVVNLVEVDSLPFSLPIQGPLEFRHSPNDISGDGKTGLEDAVKALQTVADMP